MTVVCQSLFQTNVVFHGENSKFNFQLKHLQKCFLNKTNVLLILSHWASEWHYSKVKVNKINNCNYFDMDPLKWNGIFPSASTKIHEHHNPVQYGLVPRLWFMLRSWSLLHHCFWIIAQMSQQWKGQVSLSIIVKSVLTSESLKGARRSRGSTDHTQNYCSVFSNVSAIKVTNY